MMRSLLQTSRPIAALATISVTRASSGATGSFNFYQLRSIPPKPRYLPSRDLQATQSLRRFSAISAIPDYLQPALATKQHCHSIIKSSTNLGIMDINRDDRLFPARPSATLHLNDEEQIRSRQGTPEQKEQLKLQQNMVQAFTTKLTGSDKPWTADDLPEATRLKIMKQIEQLAQKSGLGDCGEHSVLAWLHLNRQEIKPVELIVVNSHYDYHDFNHAVVVINRPEDSDLPTPASWGKDCIICDPWLGAVFSADNYGAMWLAWPQIYKPDEIRCLIKSPSTN